MRDIYRTGDYDDIATSIQLLLYLARKRQTLQNNKNVYVSGYSFTNVLQKEMAKKCYMDITGIPR